MKKLDQFHDGFLDGLLIQEAIVWVFLSTVAREEFVLGVRGVSSLKADGFRSGNIIFDVLVRYNDGIVVDDMVNFFGYTDETSAHRRLKDVRAKNLKVIEINPSYGASCIILAESVELLPRNQVAHFSLVSASD